jgi:secreted PhoX family phosphatase
MTRFSLLCGTAALALSTGAALAADITSVEFTNTPAPGTDAEILTTHTKSSAIVRYSDGTTKEAPLSYVSMFKNTDSIGGRPAAQLYNAKGEPLMDPNGDPVIAETPDANSLLDVDGKLYMVTHYEYDWILGNGAEARRTEGWYSRMPMSMSLAAVEQAEDGTLKATSVKPIDFSGVQGLWIPCAGGPTPWNTHLGSEEDYDLYFQAVSGEKNRKKTTEGLRALSEMYLGGAEANPYHYGFIPEVTVKADGTTSVVKHYSMGRATWELARVMPDSRTAYFGDDGNHVALFMYVADKPEDLSAGTLYAARWNQVSGEGGGAATLDWVKLGHATDAEVRAIIDSGVTFDDIFDSTTAEATPDWKAQGYRMVRAGHSGDEILRLKEGMEKAAAFLESRRYAGYLGATTEFNKMEGVAADPKKKNLYLAMSYNEKGMQAEEGAAQDHIQVEKITAGATYEIAMDGGRVDTEGNPIDSAWVGTAMRVPSALLGEDIEVDALGNTAHPDKIANPDNLFFSPAMRTLFIGEDSGTHVNNFVWAYNVDTGKLSRILSQAAGAEATGLQVIDNLNGHAYVMANNQHQGDWISSMPEDVVARLEAAAIEKYGTNSHGTPNFKLQAHVGYLGGLPGLNGDAGL